MEHVNDIDDRLSRAIGIPGFGLSIPHLTGLFGPIGPSDPRFWAGTLWFVLLAGLVWQGNRWLLFRQRERLDWMSQPIGKIAFMVVGCVFYTAPVTAGMIALWYLGAGLPIAMDVGTIVVLTNVICVLVVTHVYETAFLVKARKGDLLELERSQRLRSEAELAALRAQVDPHFLFNSLTTLGWLIETDPEAGADYTRRLAQVYRYILANRERDLVQLTDELAFFDDCLRLLEVRFGDALAVSRTGLDDPGLDRLLVPPISLQVLLENAVKHNAFSEREPLEVRVVLNEEHIEVANSRRERPDRVPSEGLGLSNLGERYRRLLGRDIDVSQGEGEFSVRLPVARLG